jgi:hypothetical protein
MAVSVGGMRASRYPTCFATDVSSRDDSLVVLESVGRPHNTVLRGKDMDCIKHRLAWLRRTRAVRNSPRRSMEGMETADLGGAW